MARLRIGSALVLSVLLSAAAALAQNQPPAAAPFLYDRPVLVIDPGMHTAMIRRASVDAEGRWAVTGSVDKTVRVWSLADGALLRTIRMPAGPGNVGKVYAVAMSPDGALIAAGGMTRWADADHRQQIYIYKRESGALVHRIEGVSSDVEHLTFSPDGRLLAATLSGGGLRIYGRYSYWTEVARDEEYGDASYGADFASDGRLATTAYDGKVRIYAGDLKGSIRPVTIIATLGGLRPYGIAFNPDGSRLVIGYDDSAAVDLLDGRTFRVLPGPNLDGIHNGTLNTIAWSRDGTTLFAAGKYGVAPRLVILAWSDADGGTRRMLLARQDIVMSLVPLPGGDLLAAAGDPWLGRLGGTRWAHGPILVDFRDLRLSVSNDGTIIDFSFGRRGSEPARFDVGTLALSLNPLADQRTAGPRVDVLPITGWKQTASPTVDGWPLELDPYETSHSLAISPAGDRLGWEQTASPTIDGRPLELAPYETSHSLAISPAGDRFVLGADWSLRSFDAKGTPVWTRSVRGTVWAVNITGDSRLVVVAYADGTIRWHRMSDGVELLAFMPLPDKTNWVAWTPEGYYAATAGARSVLRWHVNRGWDQPADNVAIEDIPSLYRPAALPFVLQELEIFRALGRADYDESRRQIMLRTNSRLPPGVKLHLLTIGIDAYNEEYAKNLRLHYAGSDARDLASAITNTQAIEGTRERQGGLYAAVEPQVLLDKEASKAGIIRALETMRQNMAKGGGDDLAVVHFSGHGALVDGTLYLLPADVDARDTVGIKTSGLSIDQFRGELLELAKLGRVLVLLDACHSGATTMNGTTLVMDATALRTALAAANVTVLTSSNGSQVSRENAAWQHGAFTKALLDAFNDPAADINHNGLINPTGLGNYLTTHVGSLTAGAQTPGMEIRYDTTVFAVGM
jgi:WD40 repeat protein